MSHSRGAPAPTPGAQDDVELNAAALDLVVGDVASHARAWALTAPRERADLLGQVVRDTYEVAEEWNDAACAAKGYDPMSPEGGEELFRGIGTFVRMTQALRQSLLDIATKGRPDYPGPVRHAPGRRIAV